MEDDADYECDDIYDLYDFGECVCVCFLFYLFMYVCIFFMAVDTWCAASSKKNLECLCEIQALIFYLLALTD